ncbi:MAG: ribose-phosphate pyrophosphokinase [Lachnospiraceae bacterium]|nr:ribose-phosphate pyrophosphokinase [Lachnospiraceae bacterium]
MSKDYTFGNSIPIAPLKIVCMENCRELGNKVNDYIVNFRHNDEQILKDRRESLQFRGYDASTYLVENECPRFGTGEAKGILNESVRGCDVFLMADVMNYSMTYTVCGHTNHYSPDDHYQDLKRLVAAAITHARRVNVVMPFLYESRQHKRTRRESLDCASSLTELVNMGVSNIITFDAHDPRVQNAIPLHGFDNYQPPYQFIRTLLKKENDLIIDSDHLMIISPDEGAMNRSIYFANNLGVDVGMFYKRRDYSTVVGGKNPIVAHEFLGADVSGKTVIIVDDMIASGESMLDTARELKERKASKVIVCCTFGLFTEGFERFDEYYNRGYFDYVITTNLNYRPAELLSKPWYLEADMSKFLASIINTMNHDVSTTSALTPTERIQKLLRAYNENEPLDDEEE